MHATLFFIGTHGVILLSGAYLSTGQMGRTPAACNSATWALIAAASDVDETRGAEDLKVRITRLWQAIV
jgi:hypothetical protein